MAIKKIVRRHGSSVGLNFNMEECSVYDIKEGDILEIEIKSLIRKKKKIESFMGV